MCLQGGVEGVLKGSERPEAGQPRRIYFPEARSCPKWEPTSRPFWGQVF